jgi:hypothetical protein
MFNEKKSIDFLYYLACLSEEELKKDKEKFYKLKNELNTDYKEVFYYIYGDIFKLSKRAEIIYKKVLEK